jgi:large subunit ribosomal protein L23
MGFLDRFKKTKKGFRTNGEEVKDAEVLDVKSANEESAKEKTPESKPKKAVTVKGNAYKIILKPHVTEKAATGEVNGAYVFVVNKYATKVDVKNAIKQIYGVMPVNVRIVNTDGKKIRFGYSHGMRSSWKKAIVTLPKGKAIDIHAGV